MRQPLDAAGVGGTVEEHGGVCSGLCLPEAACGCILESCSAWPVHTLLKTMISKAGPDVRVRFKRAWVLSELLQGRHRMVNEPRLDGHSVSIAPSRQHTTHSLITLPSPMHCAVFIGASLAINLINSKGVAHQASLKYFCPRHFTSQPHPPQSF